MLVLWIKQSLLSYSGSVWIILTGHSLDLQSNSGPEGQAPLRRSPSWHAPRVVSIVTCCCAIPDPKNTRFALAAVEGGEEGARGRQLLVVLDDLTVRVRSLHSPCFGKLQAHGLDLHFRLAQDCKLLLDRYGQYLCDGLGLFALSARSDLYCWGNRRESK